MPLSAAQTLRKVKTRSQDLSFWLYSMCMDILGSPRPTISDATWYDLQFRHHDASRYYGIHVPSLPPDEVQLRFTGRTSHDNIRQAFDFYAYVCSVCQLDEIASPKVLDFGGGWGRIARLFLRDTTPQRISVADCLSESIEWLRATRNPCNIIQNDPSPPIAGLDGDFDLIYAFSVFSHLSEKHENAWVDYLMSRLRKGGHLVITTRGHRFVEDLDRRRRNGLVDDLTTMLPSTSELYARHASGEFQFYSTGGGSELEPEFYGEALIPRSYFERKYGAQLVHFTEDVTSVDQAVVVLKRG